MTGRAAFAALLAAGVFVQLGLGAPASGDLLPAARAALQRAGYRVGPERRVSWADGATRVEERADFVARYPACALPIRIRSRSIFERDGEDALGSFHIFGNRRGATIPRLSLLAEKARMQARFVLSLGRGRPPVPSLLVVDDPSACLALADPDWRSIWYGE